MDGNKQLTIILPLLGKEYYTEIWLENNLYKDFNYIIVDGSKNNKNEILVKSKIENCIFDIYYFKYENENSVSDWVKKIAIAASYSKTKFTMTMDNDDFLNKSGIIKCLNKLEERSEYSFASGEIHFVSKNQNKYLIKKNKHSFLDYKEGNTEFENIQTYLSHNNKRNGYVWYSIYRTNIFVKVWEEIYNSKIYDIFIIEYLNTQLSFCYGRLLRVNTNHLIRLTNPTIKSTSSKVNYGRHIVNNILFKNEERLKIVDMCKYISAILQIDESKLENIYINKFTYQKNNKGEISLKRMIINLINKFLSILIFHPVTNIFKFKKINQIRSIFSMIYYLKSFLK